MCVLYLRPSIDQYLITFPAFNKLSFTMEGVLGGGGGGGGRRDAVRSGMYVHPERLMVRKAISCNGYCFFNSAERILGCECLRSSLIVKGTVLQDCGEVLCR